MNNKQLVILIIVGVVLFLLGGGLGIIYTQKEFAQIKATVDGLSSKVVSSINVSGQVIEIEGRNITLNNQGDSLVVPIAPYASFYSSTPEPSIGGVFTSEQKPAGFEDIKIGDNANVVLKLLPNGKLEGLSIVFSLLTAK